MKHATITRHTATICVVAFDYDVATRNAVKELAGATYADGAWLVPILHLPVLKLIFSTMTVAPDVVANYHELLRQMLCDFVGSQHRKGALGTHIAELIERHAVGIAAVTAKGWQPSARTKMPKTIEAAPAFEDEDTMLGLWLRGSKNAVANAAKKARMAKERRWQKQNS